MDTLVWPDKYGDNEQLMSAATSDEVARLRETSPDISGDIARLMSVVNVVGDTCSVILPDM